ncbi:MAG: hypothetical protein F4X47_03035 [Gammaproteobacteria bacterium]|nr:hypothetical protein [Gammaproteobacteria bacterium]MYC51274.1 hypothetical protein [Gammaproteobacteria bacterium]
MNRFPNPASTSNRRVVVSRSVVVGALALALALVWGSTTSAQPSVSGGICDDWGCHSGEEKCMTIGPVTCWDDEN